MELPLKIELRKERSFSDKMNGMFTYLSQNFKVIFRCLLFIVGPVALLAGICNGIFQYQLTKIMPLDLAKNFGNAEMAGPNLFLNMMKNIFSPVYFAAILLSTVSFVLVKCIVFSHFRLYAESPTKEVAFEEVFNAVKSVFVKVFFSVFAAYIIIAVGFVLLAIPGIYLLVALSMLLPVMIIEGAGFFDALNRCFFLIKDKWWSTFGLLAITLFMVWIGTFVFYLPMYIFQILRLTKVVGDDAEIWQILASVISSVGGLMIYSLFSFAIGMQYFNLVERREGKGLRSYIDDIGNTTESENRSNQVDL
ncbi:MAG: hypothetical protein ABI723_12205 [Bacteroidia bacterium]